MNFLSEIRGLQYCQLLGPWQIELQANTAAVCFRDITVGILLMDVSVLSKKFKRMGFGMKLTKSKLCFFYIISLIIPETIRW